MQEFSLICVKNNLLRVLLIDNYDSFTYNIVALLQQLEVDDLTLRKNDEIEAAEASLYDAILLSPGPALPVASGNLLDIVRQLAPTHPILGICLGHQAIAEAFGGCLRNEALPYHGYQTSLRFVKPHHLFDGLPRDAEDANLPASFKVGLYHSWSVDETNLPEALEVTAYSTEGNIMAMRHKTYNVHGVQFHPESYMTEYGKELIWNFLKRRS
jgi:anthranilate synthase component 2